MGVILEVKSGPHAGQKIALLTGHTLLVGRAAGRAQFAFPDDTFMSGVHFAVECAPQGCRVQDRKSSNGTLLNGARVHEAMLANGDEIKGGQTVFTVKIVADAKLASMVPPEEVVLPPAPQQLSPAREEALKPPTPVRPAAANVPSPVMQSADVIEAGDSRPEANAAAEPAPRKMIAEREPHVEAPLKSPGVPDLSPVGAKPPRASAPPVGVASQIARKFGDGPLERGDGSLQGSAFTVMGWSFPATPAQWQVQEGFGLQQSGNEEFPSSLAATEELLGGITLQQFVESQISMLRGYLRDPKIEPTMPPRVGGADESMAVDVRHSTKDGRELVYRRIYARSGASVGVLTVTTLAADLPQVLLSLQPLLEGAAFRSTANS
jgi:Inner membrane component of T3SS, cytoplasmic domain